MTTAVTIKKGYKQTELGVIPEDWETCSLKQITLDMLQGVNTAIDKPEYVHDGIPMLKANNVIDGEVIFEGADHISLKTFLGYGDRFKAKKNDFLFSNIGARLGTGSLLKLDVECSFAWNVMRIVPDTQKVTPEYLCFLINSPKYSQDIKSKQSGSGMGFVPKGVMQDLVFVLPKRLEEQTVIAAVLSDTDTLIELLEKLIAKKKTVKQGTMQQLLTSKKRLPGFSGEWEVKKFGEIGETYGGLSGKTKIDFDEGKYPYIPFMNIMSNPVIDLHYFDYVNIRSGEKQNKAIKGDLFFNGSSETPEEVGMCSVLQGDIPNLYLNSFCFGFRLKKDLKTDGLYLSYFFRSPMGRQLIFSLAQGATRYNLSKTNFMRLEIPYPDPVEQRAIAAILSNMDAEIKSLEHSRNKYSMLKQGMMQQLLTGKIRIYAN